MDVILGVVERNRAQRCRAAGIRNRISEHLAVMALSIICAAALVWVSAVVQHINNLTSHDSKYVMSDRSQSIGEDSFTGR